MLRLRAASFGVVLFVLVSAIVVGIVPGPARATTYPAAAYRFDGTVTNEFSAHAVVLMDLNADGVTDLAVGAPFNGTGGKANAGSVTFYLSSVQGSAIVAFSHVVTVFGAAAGDLFGWSLADVGDVSGEGPVLAVGAPHASPGGLAQAGNLTLFTSGAAFSGKPSAWINSTHAGEGLGYSVAAGGDVNADTVDDILAGAPFCNTGAVAGGCVYVYYGASPRPSQTPSLTFDSTVTGANFGWSLAGNGSVDGSSALDMVVGAPNYTAGGLAARGAAYVIRSISGTVRTSVVTGTNAGDQFGFSVAMGDFNGDRIDDIAIGAPYNNDGFTQAGEVSIIYGSSPFKTTIGLLLHGQAAGEWFGYAMAAGDVHQDGLGDLLVGAPGSTINATGIGRAYGFYGSPLPWTSANLTLVPGVSGANAFGAALAIGGNVTADGRPSLAVGDPQFTAGGHGNAGRASVYLGDIVPTLNLPRVVGWVCVPFTYTGGADPCSGIAGVTVSLTSTTQVFDTSTVANGSFALTAVPGTYWLNTTLFPYIDNSTTVSLNFNDVKTVFLFPFRRPVVSGNATDAVNRTGYAGVTVALYNATNVLVNTTTTAAGGSYAMFVPPAFFPAVGQASSMTVRMWDATHYTNQTSVSVRRNVTGYANMFLNRFPVVHGTVYDIATLSRLSGATIQATQGSTVIGSATTNNQGAYSLIATNASVPHTLFLNISRTGYGRGQTSLLVNQNASYTQDVFLQADRTPPSSNLWPLLPRYTTTAVVTLSANATDNLGVAQVQLWYRYNNTGNFVQYAVDTAAPYTFRVNTTSARGDGRYEFYTIAVDYAGNTESAPAGNDTWTWVDTVLPTLSVTAPTAGQTVLKSWVNVTWTAADSGSGLAKVDVQLDAGAWVHAGSASYANLTSVPDGSHTVNVNATDRAGNQRTVSVAFSVNTAAPVVTFNSPANHSAGASASVTLSWTITNPGAGITLLQARADGGAWQTLGTSATSYAFTGLSDGTHNLWVHAATANADTKVYLTVVVDTTPPTASITSPTGNPWLNGTSVVLAFSAADTGSGVAALSLSLDNGTAVDVTSQTSYTFTGLTDGAHQAVLTATDEVGNAATARVNFRVDRTAPSVTFSAPADGASVSSSTVAVTWLVQDAGSGLTTVQISLDGGAWQTVTPGGTQTYTALADGSHTISIRATDASGNTKTSTLGFTVNTQLLGNNALAFGLIAAIVIVVVVVALVVWRMRKPKPPAEPATEPPKPEDAEKKG